MEHTINFRGTAIEVADGCDLQDALETGYQLGMQYSTSKVIAGAEKFMRSAAYLFGNDSAETREVGLNASTFGLVLLWDLHDAGVLSTDELMAIEEHFKAEQRAQIEKREKRNSK